MSMASTLFGFNYEGYASDSSKWGWASDVININKNSKKDRKKLLIAKTDKSGDIKSYPKGWKKMTKKKKREKYLNN